MPIYFTVIPISVRVLYILFLNIHIYIYCLLSFYIVYNLFIALSLNRYITGLLYCRNCTRRIYTFFFIRVYFYLLYAFPFSMISLNLLSSLQLQTSLLFSLI